MATPSRILLTGANGFVASHIIQQLIPRGVSLRCVVRRQAAIDAIKHDFPSPAPSKIDFALVPDITASEAFHSALTDTDENFDIVIHTASPFLYKNVKNNLDFLEPAIKGTTCLLESVKAVAPSVKRVIVTSSCAAVCDLLHPEAMGGKTFTEIDWNPVTWEEAVNAPENNRGPAYQGSKKFAEEAAWGFVRTEKPGFDVVTICPPMIYGPLAHTVFRVKDLNESSARIYNLFINSSRSAPLPPNALYIYADVRDVAAAHVAAAFTPETGGKRFIVCGGQLSSQRISNLLRENVPELAERTPEGTPEIDSLPEKEKQYTASSDLAKAVLGLQFQTDESTIVELGRQLLEIEKK